jgi:hypothetical protein
MPNLSLELRVPTLVTCHHHIVPKVSGASAPQLLFGIAYKLIGGNVNLKLPEFEPCMRVWPQVTAHIRGFSESMLLQKLASNRQALPQEPRGNCHTTKWEACSCPFARSPSGRKSPVQPVSTRLGVSRKSIVAWFSGAVRAAANHTNLTGKRSVQFPSSQVHPR